ncbi:hypothetical protein L2E82_13642 [Cichorium intybus]|uniref:Uncharacterized protein n=1 Tax=Cichorium intybus TaxID=13427 RepID=A0ACB9EYD9_CICIN|nr:hypothetical protein L2E82_13642 [Cichorium intybus]
MRFSFQVNTGIDFRFSGSTVAPPPPRPSAEAPAERQRTFKKIYSLGFVVSLHTDFLRGPGLGWKSWKKRWFILTRTSLVFFKDDPSAIPQRGGKVNLTLGGVHLNNSGSVVVREDKKLLTVLFPGGRDGLAFTLNVFSWPIQIHYGAIFAGNSASLPNDGVHANISFYNTLSPMANQMSGVAPPHVCRNMVENGLNSSSSGADVSPRSTVKSTIQAPRRKFVHEGKLRKKKTSSENSWTGNLKKILVGCIERFQWEVTLISL